MSRTCESHMNERKLRSLNFGGVARRGRLATQHAGPQVHKRLVRPPEHSRFLAAGYPASVGAFQASTFQLVLDRRQDNGELNQGAMRVAQNCGCEPVRLLDPETNQEYVLVPAESYRRIQALLSDLDPRELYPALHRAMDQEGWNDLRMDEYNRYG